jgi:hypothetical protein
MFTMSSYFRRNGIRQLNWILTDRTEA